MHLFDKKHKASATLCHISVSQKQLFAFLKPVNTYLPVHALFNYPTFIQPIFTRLSFIAFILIL